MNDSLPADEFDGQADPLAQFCEGLDTSLEVLVNLLFLATRENIDLVKSREWLRIANETLKDVREVVLAHCDTDRNPVERAA